MRRGCEAGVLSAAAGAAAGELFAAAGAAAAVAADFDSGVVEVGFDSVVAVAGFASDVVVPADFDSGVVAAGFDSGAPAADGVRASAGFNAAADCAAAVGTGDEVAEVTAAGDTGAFAGNAAPSDVVPVGFAAAEAVIGAGASAVPQTRHNFASSGFVALHFEHT